MFWPDEDAKVERRRFLDDEDDREFAEDEWEEERAELIQTIVSWPE